MAAHAGPTWGGRQPAPHTARVARGGRHRPDCPQPSRYVCWTATRLLGGRSWRKTWLSIQALAATSMLAPLPSCRGGQATRQVLTAARMCFGQAPVGAAPSQHSCFQAATLKRGARLKQDMQNSASPARTHWCDLKGRSCAMALRSCTTPCTGSGPAASAAAAWPTPSAAAPASPAAACLAPALVRLCMALTQPCQAA